MVGEEWRVFEKSTRILGEINLGGSSYLLVLKLLARVLNGRERRDIRRNWRSFMLFQGVYLFVDIRHLLLRLQAEVV